MNPRSSKKVLYAALVGNVLVAITKLGAAFLTGSSAMLSEAVHSVVDTANEMLLLYGMRRAARPADARHPFGHGREIYFWSFMVALLIFTLGAGVSIRQGIQRTLHPVEVTRPEISYGVLALAALFEGASWWVALREFRKVKGDRGYLEAIRRSKDPPGFMVLLEDTAALLGIGIALAGTMGAQLLHQPRLDGAASILIGLLLGAVALLLAQETKALLLGEEARPEVIATICEEARELPGILHANGLFTVQLGPREVFAAMSVEFEDGLSARQVEELISKLEERVRSAHPEVVSLLVKPQNPEDFQDAHRRRFGDGKASPSDRAPV